MYRTAYHVCPQDLHFHVLLIFLEKIPKPTTDATLSPVPIFLMFVLPHVGHPHFVHFYANSDKKYHIQGT